MNDEHNDKKKLNGHTDNVTPFPSKKERQDIIKQKLKSAKQAKPASEPIVNIPPATKMLCLILLTIHVVLYTLLPLKYLVMAYAKLSFMPYIYTEPFNHLLMIFTAPITHGFLHGGWMHILINLAMLIAFGSGVERLIGARAFWMFFILSVIGGAAVHLIFFWGTVNPMIGASGGISGLFGVLMRLLQDRGQMPPGWRGLAPVCLIWVGISVLFALFGSVPGENAEIAWSAHVGGFATGLFAYPLVFRWLNKS